MSRQADELPRATFTKLKKEGVWGARIEQTIQPGSVLDVEVVRRDGTYVTKTVEVFWCDADLDISLAKFASSD